MRLIDADELIVIEYGGIEFVPKEFIDDAPAIDAVPVRHGKWIDKSGGIEGAWNHCSVCGERAIDLYDYCPNCGATMDEAEP